ncbi:hypothetical protein [Bradyrhizobium sp.]
MKWRILFLLWFLLLAEDLSRMMAGGSGPCLITPESGQQVANGNQPQDCPTFFAGTLIVFERSYNWIKHDDNDKAVVAAFTVVLALSTIGLWLATNKLWAAGEKQFGLLSESAAAQSRDMKRSIEAFEDMSKEAKKANEISEKSVLSANRAWVGIESAAIEVLEIGEPIKGLITIRNTGQSPALQLRGRFNTAVLKKEESPEDPATIQIDPPTNVLIPNGSYLYPIFSGSALTQQAMDLIRAGDVRIWIVGKVEYWDASGFPHRSIYKLSYDIESKGFGATTDGNDAT